MSVRSFQKKQRNQRNRNPKPVMLITAEGKNKTEMLYFTSFQSQHGKYSLKFIKTGGATDPAGMLRALQKYWDANELSKENGDKAYIVLDLDCNKSKADSIVSLMKKNDEIQFVVSNTCIEVWYLLHFRYSTSQYIDSKIPKKELQKYIPNYTEASDVAALLKPLLPIALQNADKLQKHHEKSNTPWISIECNPMTDIPIIIKELQI